MKPLLAHIYEPKRYLGGACWLQPKLNGVRALYQSGHFQSRDLLPWNPRVLRHIADVLREIYPPHVILDGELYHHGWPLQQINGAVMINRHEPSEDTPQIQFHVFDQVKYGTSFYERFEEIRVKAAYLRDTPIQLVQTVKITEPADAEPYYMKWVSEGYEGMMYRIGPCPYTVPKQIAYAGDGPVPGIHGLNSRPLKFLSDQNNRVWHMLKRKDWHDAEYRIVAVLEGEGKRRGMVGAFVCQTVTGVQFQVGSGLTDHQAKHWFENQPIGQLARVKYLTLTTDGKPFNPTIEAVL